MKHKTISNKRLEMIKRLYKEEIKVRKRSRMPIMTFEEYMKRASGTWRGKQNNKRVLSSNKKAIEQSLPTSDMVGNGFKRDEKQYTGDKLIGITTMHKSNMVPVFSKEAAIEISKMRRN